jgi:hypothetical protein
MDLEETVPLPETSDVLEILFQFIHPPSEAAGYRQPSVMQMEPNLFFKVAEAAEKYAVFGAMNLCVTWMQYAIVSPLSFFQYLMTTSHIVEDHPLRILNHSGKHGYTELSDKAAEISVRCSLADAGRQITHPGLLGKWVGPLFNTFDKPQCLFNRSISACVLPLLASAPGNTGEATHQRLPRSPAMALRDSLRPCEKSKIDRVSTTSPYSPKL